jgi:hypothetical protein
MISREGPPKWAKVLVAVLGVALILWELLIDDSEHWVIYGPAIVMTGVPLPFLDRFMERLGR